MNFARVFMPLVGWTTRTVRAFLGLSDVSEQMAYWRKHLDTHRFRAALDALFSPAILRALYAPQLLASLPPRFGSVLRKRLETGFDRHPNASNPYARALLLGENDETTQTTMRTSDSFWPMRHRGSNRALSGALTRSRFRIF
jgi:hypothetical protein